MPLIKCSLQTCVAEHTVYLLVVQINEGKTSFVAFLIVWGIIPIYVHDNERNMI